METKSTFNKKKIILVTIILLLAASAFITFMVLKMNKGYRIIQIYQLQGNVTIDRDKAGIMDAYENLILQSGDGLNVAKKSSSRLKLDEDKYMLVEPESLLKVVALGEEENSKTDIELKQGAVTVEIRNKLTRNSHYRITTPNAVMAVRGTVFRIDVTLDKNGKPVTRISLFEGTVSVQKINVDGTLSKEQVMNPGREALIYFDQKDNKIEISNKINYKELPGKSLEFLLEVSERERQLPVSRREIQELIKQEQQAEQNQRNNPNTSKQEPEPPETAANSPDQQRLPLTIPQDPTAQSPNAPLPEVGQRPNVETPEKPTQRPSVQVPEKEPSQNGNNPDQQTKAPDYYSVTFKYRGSVLGVQKVKSGETAQKPTLKPAKTGGWDFNFSTPITKDTVVEFK